MNKNNQALTNSCKVRRGVNRVLMLVFIAMSSGCELVDSDDDGTTLWNSLASYQEIGSLTADQIADLYPTGIDLITTYDVTLYRVVYHTENPNGQHVRASGVILIPEGRARSPILSLHRTTIFHEDEAPSNVIISDLQDRSDFNMNGNTVWTNFAPVVASAGFITVMPDLLGWGESSEMTPPYLVSFSEAIVSLDMLRAAVELLDTEDTGWNDELFVTGYSQGGSTAMSLLRSIQEDPLRQFEVTRAAAGGGAYNFEELAEVILDQEELAFAPYYLFFLQSYRNVYFPERPMSTFLLAPYDMVMDSDSLFEGDYTADELERMFPDRTDLLFLNRFRNDYLTSGELQGPENELRRAFIENDLSRFRVESPLRIYHGDQDEIIPITQTEQSVQSLRDAGTEELQLITIEGGTHRGSAQYYLLDTFLWFLNPGIPLPEFDLDM